MNIPDAHVSNTSFAEGQQTDIGIIEFKRLLIDLLEKRPYISIRYRLIGHLWNNGFYALKEVFEEYVIFVEPERQTEIRVQIKNIMQIELDGSFQAYRPNFHYTITLTMDK
jgi:hypothetical protein